MEGTGEIPRLTKLVGADGKQRKAKRPAAIMAPNAKELRAILNRLREGVDDIEGFVSEHGLPTLQAPDPFDGLDDSENREWCIAILSGMPMGQFEWVRRRDFRTPTEYYGPEGQRFMASIGLPLKDLDIERRWEKTLARYDGKDLAEIKVMMNEVEA